jgi:N-acetylmuramoyl-L-alanine amidase
MNLRVLCLLCLNAALHATALGFDTVVIDAGHGGSDPGAVRGRLYEKTLCLDVAQRLESVLKAKGLHTVMTRRTDKTVSLNERARVANRYPRAVFVSVHFNASRDRSARGMETHYLSAKGKLLATAIQNMLDSRVVGKDRGIKEEDFKVLRATKGTAVLVECGFISNAADAANCGSWKHRANVAQSIAAGLLSLRSKL